MADGRKRPGLAGLSDLSARRQRRRRADEHVSCSRAIGAVLAVLVAVGVVSAGASAVAESYTPQARQSAYSPQRLDWEKHVNDLSQRGEHCFKRYYRMSKESFYKLVELLRPRLEANPHFGGLRSKYGAISVEIRLAVALRVLAGGSYLDIGLLFGVAFQSVYQILWEVIDAINSTPSVGPFKFPQTESDCRRQADKWQALSTNGVFANVVAAADGLLVKTEAPSASDTLDVTSYYSGSKAGYGINVQATCDSRYRFCQVSAISPGATNDYAAWNRSSLSEAVNRLPGDYCIVADAAYPLSDKILTPYPGKGLALGFDSFNFHLSQLRVRIEQSYGILVSVWGILWRPIKVQFAGRASLIIALFHLHNFLRDERDEPLEFSEEDESSGRHRPRLAANGTLPPEWQTAPSPSRSGETGARAEIRFQLEQDKQWRPVYNTIRNSLVEAAGKGRAEKIEVREDEGRRL